MVCLWFLIGCMFHCLPQHGRTVLQAGKKYILELMHELNACSTSAAEFNGNYYAPVMIQSDNP